MRQELFNEVVMAMEYDPSARVVLVRALERWKAPRPARMRAMGKLALQHGLDDSILWTDDDMTDYPEAAR